MIQGDHSPGRSRPRELMISPEYAGARGPRRRESRGLNAIEIRPPDPPARCPPPRSDEPLFGSLGGSGGGGFQSGRAKHPPAWPKRLPASSPALSYLPPPLPPAPAGTSPRTTTSPRRIFSGRAACGPKSRLGHQGRAGGPGPGRTDRRPAGMAIALLCGRLVLTPFVSTAGGLPAALRALSLCAVSSPSGYLTNESLRTAHLTNESRKLTNESLRSKLTIGGGRREADVAYRHIQAVTRL